MFDDLSFVYELFRIEKQILAQAFPRQADLAKRGDVELPTIHLLQEGRDSDFLLDPHGAPQEVRRLHVPSVM